MSKYEQVALGILVSEYSERNRTLACKDVYSVTNSQGFMPSSDYFSKEVFSKYISTYKTVHRGMFAYNPSRVNVGSLAWLKDKDTVVVSPLYVVFKVEESKVHQQLLEYYLHSDLAIAQIRSLTSGSVRDSLKFSALARIVIPLPPLEQQQQIIEALDCISEVIKKRRKQMAVLDKLITDTFIDMFGKGEFEKVYAEDVCGFITKGTTPPTKQIYTENNGDYIPYLKVYNLSANGELLFWDEPQYIDKSVHNGVLARSIVYPNDILMNIVGPPLGKFALVNDEFPEWNVNQAIAIFRSKERINHLYLLYALMQSSVLKPLLESAVGIRQLNLNLQQCRKLEIQLPPMDLQIRFASVVENIHKQKSCLKASLAELETTYKSTLQKAFNGELFQ